MIAMARRIAYLAGEALHLARRDIDASRRHGLGQRGDVGGLPAPVTARS
jgi:hypothetical protein